jgi:hypothetical protein
MTNADTSRTSARPDRDPFTGVYPGDLDHILKSRPRLQFNQALP